MTTAHHRATVLNFGDCILENYTFPQLEVQDEAGRSKWLPGGVQGVGETIGVALFGWSEEVKVKHCSGFMCITEATSLFRYVCNYRVTIIIMRTYIC